ncbi:uncharacterized protein LOC130137832 [Syzygium oleosum]|uniref:uncharacterized protein LOC130137832 n=1 Tax=Syzygium oleosum TaxID=219896 RepID=UPI0024BB9478|nr:uncharacterized protein LOC130137832 [Syzygium oleosum]
MFCQRSSTITPRNFAILLCDQLMSSQGRFVINVLQGSLNRKYGLLTLWMTDTDGAHIGGCLAGPLIAGNQVQIVFGTFEDTIERKYKRKRSATAPAAAGEVDDGELVDVPVCAGEMVEANANGSSPGPEGSDGGEPIMASPITIVPPASTLPEGSEEEEPIMVSPITIVPPASSPPEGSEEEEPIMASPITIVPPASSLPEGSEEEEPIMASPITIVPPASSLPKTPDDPNE